MTTTISYFTPREHALACPDVNMYFILPASDFNRNHEGIWNSRTMSFVPKLPDTFMVGNCPDTNPEVPTDQNDDGYRDASGTYFDECVVCGVPASGNRYCGASCEQRDTEERGL